jgi:hypothetical protein
MGQSDVSLRGLVLDTDSIRTFDRDDGSEGRVSNLTLGDETGRIRVTLWDDRADRAAELDAVAVDADLAMADLPEGHGPDLHDVLADRARPVEAVREGGPVALLPCGRELAGARAADPTALIDTVDAVARRYGRVVIDSPAGMLWPTFDPGTETKPGGAALAELLNETAPTSGDAKSTATRTIALVSRYCTASYDRPGPLV